MHNANVNIFHSDRAIEGCIETLVPELKAFTAKELTCGDIALTSEEVSVRIVMVNGIGMIAPIELEVTAHAFEDRITRQDEIRLHIRKFMKEKLSTTQDVRVWLLLLSSDIVGSSN